MMSAILEIGDRAPDFDLASTEDVMLMLRDEVPRTPVLLFFFGEIEAGKAQLEALGRMSPELARAGVKTMAISNAKLDELKAVQRELHLGFPLLHDDRNLSAAYRAGAALSEQAVESTTLTLVGRDQRILWIERDAVSEDAIRSAVASARKVSSTVNYPRRVINRLVDRWVN